MNKSDKALVARMKELRELLKEFDAVLYGYDPGVSFYAKTGNMKQVWDPLRPFGPWEYEPEQVLLRLDGREWKWLEPLLKELCELRKMDKRNKDRREGPHWLAGAVVEKDRRGKKRRGKDV